MDTGSHFNNSVEQSVNELADLLLDNNLIMSTAESCTGGWIAQVLTAKAGSSAWFDTGFVTYSNEAKQRLLSVPSKLFMAGAPGAVSEETVKAMTDGAIKNSRAAVSVSVSGVAGPSGGSADKPVGTVWIAWQYGDKSIARRFQFAGGRHEIRAATVLEALAGLIDLLA